MMRFKIKELIAQKEFDQRRKITLAEVSKETGVNRTSLSKMINPSMKHSTTTNSIEALCRYFECSVEDIMEYAPEKED